MFERFNGNVVPFADESTSTNRTVFGSETQSDDIDDNLNADFKKGWEIVGLNDNPTREDFNAMGYTLGYLISYLYQNGVAEYNLLQEYKTNSIAIGTDGNIYQSLVDNNLGNALTDTTKWVCIASKNSIVNNIAELKTISNIESINVLGYYEKGDGGGGTFYWDATSNEADNGGTIIQATGVTTGRWKRVFSGAVNVKWFGAKGDSVTDDFQCLQNAFNFKGRIIFDKEISYKCNSKLTIDISKTTVDLNGNTLDFSSITSGSYIDIIRTESDANLQNLYNHIHLMENGVLKGNSSSNPNINALYINDANNVISGLQFNNLGFLNCGKDVIFGNGAFCIDFNHCNFTVTDGNAPTTYSINAPTSTNAGERITFNNCMWNNRDFVFEHSNPNGNMFFINCSFDYSPYRIGTVNAGSVRISDSHIEQGTNSSYWFACVSGANTSLVIDNCELINQDSNRTIPYFYSDVSCTSSGVTITNSRFTGVYIVDKICDGEGRTNITNNTFDSIFGNSVLSSFQNVLFDGTFGNTNSLNDWTISGGVARSTEESHSSAYSMALSASPEVNPLAYTVANCNSAQGVSGELYYKTTGLTGSGGTFYGTITYLSKGDVQLKQSVLFAETTNKNWTYLKFNIQNGTPKGTAKVSLVINIFNVASGTPVCYIDDIILNVG